MERYEKRGLAPADPRDFLEILEQYPDQFKWDDMLATFWLANSKWHYLSFVPMFGARHVCVGALKDVWGGETWCAGVPK